MVEMETKTHRFWLDMLETNFDPLWVYRYLSWRMNNPALRHIKGKPCLKTCVSVTLDHIYKETMGDDEEREATMNYYSH